MALFIVRDNEPYLGNKLVSVRGSRSVESGPSEIDGWLMTIVDGSRDFEKVVNKLGMDPLDWSAG